MINYDELPNREIICVDMRSFYASCSCVMLGIDPMEAYLVVAGSLHHQGSVVLAASPMMKKAFGIKTGSRLFEIPKDRRIIIVEPKMATYQRISAEISRLFNRYAPKDDIYIYSVDEAFINLDGSKHLLGSVEEISKQIKQDILREFGLTCCIGIGPNMLLAKVALDVDAKRFDGHIVRWHYQDVPTKLWPISPLSEMWGIGVRMEKRLNDLGIFSMGDLANANLKLLETKFGVMGKQLFYHAWGVDHSEIGIPITPKSHSIGNSQMLMRDFYELEEIKVAILEMCEEVASRTRRRRAAGRTISLGIMYNRKTNHKGFSRSHTIDHLTNITLEIYQVCVRLLEQHHVEGLAVRKIFVRLSNVEADLGTFQLDLFDDKSYKRRDVGFAMDQIRLRYGKNSLLRAVSATKHATARHRNGLIGGHKA